MAELAIFPAESTFDFASFVIESALFEFPLAEVAMDLALLA